MRPTNIACGRNMNVAHPAKGKTTNGRSGSTSAAMGIGDMDDAIIPDAEDFGVLEVTLKAKDASYVRSIDWLKQPRKCAFTVLHQDPDLINSSRTNEDYCT